MKNLKENFKLKQIINVLYKYIQVSVYMDLFHLTFYRPKRGTVRWTNEEGEYPLVKFLIPNKKILKKIYIRLSVHIKVEGRIYYHRL